MPLGEFDLIERYFSRGNVRRDVLLGVGDDAALLEVPSGRALAAAVDTLVEGRHFLPDAPPESVGHQALAVNLSDLAADGRRSRVGVAVAVATPIRRGLAARIERRMAIHRSESPARYADFLEDNTQEIDLLFKELLIGVTSFFRDPAVWEHLAEVALPELLSRRTSGDSVRARSIGCSTGEEAYSLAMVFCEAADRMPGSYHLNLQIFASDLSADAIASARRGQYPLSISASVSAGRLARFFSAHETHYQINHNIRDMVLFAQHDVVLDAPFTKLDLIACRNLLIYFGPLLQRRLLPLLHYSLRPGGLLLLGHSETVGQFSRLFVAVESKLRLYLRQENVSFGGPNFLLTSFPPLSRIAQESTMILRKKLDGK